jgi:hypothetical protein
MFVPGQPFQPIVIKSGACLSGAPFSGQCYTTLFDINYVAICVNSVTILRQYALNYAEKCFYNMDTEPVLKKPVTAVIYGFS